jgi:hypothetical protein
VVQATPTTHEIQDAERAFIEAKRELRAVLEERRDSLSPATAAMIDHNLEIIEQAISEISVALERDPSNRQRNQMLMTAHRREINLLRRVTHQAARL